ncbi:MAG: phage terminase large subunit [Alphaproteobacteria bacterium]|nr:phage terminase large subunit [Alphaproteobacteria bacterium]
MAVSKEYLGFRLLQRGFRDWFLYLFRIIDGNDFVIEKVHEDMFDQFQRVLDGLDTRINENLCPRSAKTTLAKYFVVYTMTKNPRSHIIYTSFSQDLLMQIAQEIASIMQNPVYRAMYPATAPQLSQEQLDPIDEFWKDYLFENTKETKFSSRKITTAYGGVVLFASIGSAITGFGAGRRESKEFAGCLIIDDANKPADIRSDTMRKKVHTYFVETLFTRLNSSDTPVINIQQRLHVEDLTGFLESTYGFKTFKHPLLDENGECTLLRQYTPERVKELQMSAYTFASQYQQTPVIEGGNLIKTDWFVRYGAPPAKPDSLFIVADTAFTEKKSADNSAFGLFATVGKDLYMLDGYCKKVIFPDLCRDMVSFYQSAKARYNTVALSAIYIENKGSGISLIQQLREKGLPVRELMPTVHNAELKKDQVTDKFTRFNEVAADLESGYFHIPESAHWLLEFINECEAFTGGKQDAHDDYVDVLIYALKIRRKAMQTDWGALKNNFMMGRF